MHSTTTTGPSAQQADPDFGQQLREMNEALLMASIRQHELAEQARKAEAALRDSETRYRRLFQSSRDGILILSAQTGKIIDANAWMAGLLGQDQPELVGKELWEIGLLADPAVNKEAIELLQRDCYLHYDHLPIQNRSGETVYVAFTSNVYLENDTPIIQCSIRDITERKRLTDERAQLLKSEREAHQACEAANRSKDVFLATLSHELRTPLNSILGWAVLLRTSGKCDNGDVAEGLEVIERNARVQAKLIEDVLDVAGIASGKFAINLQPCDLPVLAFATVDTVRPTADAKKITIDIRTDAEIGADGLWILGDAARLQQVLSNLLNNAIKFTPSGGRVAVRLDKHGQNARVTMTDTGRGIPASFLPYVFDRFKQADEGTTRVYGGLGLGLSIVRQIVEQHDGTVKAESKGEGLGSTFTLEFPLHMAAPSRLTAPVNVEEIPALDHLRVLVVDDEDDTRDLIGIILESAGAVVLSARSAEEGFQLAQAADPFDVLVCDIGMPGEDGYSLIRRLRNADFGAKRLPAVALTAFAAPQDKRRALLAGFQVHVTKPMDPQDLIAVVASLAGRTGN